MSEFYWTYIFDEPCDTDYRSMKAAQEAADIQWEQDQADNDDMDNGDVFTEEIKLIGYKYDDDGERVIIASMKGMVEYTHYHGDSEEHFNQSDFI